MWWYLTASDSSSKDDIHSNRIRPRCIGSKGRRRFSLCEMFVSLRWWVLEVVCGLFNPPWVVALGEGVWSGRYGHWVCEYVVGLDKSIYNRGKGALGIEAQSHITCQKDSCDDIWLYTSATHSAWGMAYWYSSGSIKMKTSSLNKARAIIPCKAWGICRRKLPFRTYDDKEDC